MTTTELARLIAGTRPGTIPADALGEAKRSLLNWLGVAIGAAKHPLVDKVLDVRPGHAFGGGAADRALTALTALPACQIGAIPVVDWAGLD